MICSLDATNGRNNRRLNAPPPYAAFYLMPSREMGAWDRAHFFCHRIVLRCQSNDAVR
jgi:hypothetical protein